jgi:RNA-directed DNA polymerase
MCRRYQSQPVDRVIQRITPILRGWVTYCAIGDASRSFGYVRDWVEKKVRRHLMRARKRRGFGWQRGRRRWLYDRLGLFPHSRVHRRQPLRLKALPA